MRTLLFTALKDKANRALFLVILAAMLTSTLASQLEIFALGFMTQKGPTLFELFHNGKGQEPLYLHEVQQQWPIIAGDETAPLTPREAMRYHLKRGDSKFLSPLFLKVDEWLGAKEHLGRLALALMAVALFKALAMFWHRMSTKFASIRISASLRQRYFEHIQTLPMSFYQKYNSGALSSRVVADSALVADALNACLVNYFQTPFTVITTLLFCFFTSWRLTLLIFIGFPLLILPIAFLSRGVKRVSKKIQGIQEQFTSTLLDFIGGIQTVKIFKMEQFSLQKYKEQNRKMAELEKKSAAYDLSARPVVHTIAMAFLSMALLYGLYILGMEVSEVFFFCGMLYLFYEPIKKFAEENSHIQRGVAAAERMLEVMQLKAEIVDDPHATAITSFQDLIEFDNVEFAYGEQPVLKGICLKIKKGSKVAIVGPTGAGKSTIAQLLPRLYDPRKGEIRIDGISLKRYTQDSIRSLISYVPQRPFLFMDTIAANIAHGTPCTLEKIEEAARQAHAAEFIDLLPERYATLIEEGGKNFSGGQQQRLAIARALIKEAPILIMDEATSSLDTISEDLIKKALQELKGSITQIIIAHRLSTIEDADLIVLLDQGKIVDQGTHEELLRRSPLFKQMWDLFYSTS